MTVKLTRCLRFWFKDQNNLFICYLSTVSSGILIGVDIKHKIIRTSTVLQFMNDVITVGTLLVKLLTTSKRRVKLALKVKFHFLVAFTTVFLSLY